ncbi:hypothetical protein F5Y13DRAFT_56390 [Hypoxylon sp. FL1857]|nr:hypothetical protein F5Y13DRAFT_56390 [Hypoxylon sp. FL1857]
MDRPSVSALADIAEKEPQNLQNYVDQIVHLQFLCDDAIYHKIFERLRFPDLEVLSLDANDLNNDKSLESYLQPKLKRFRFYGGPISDAFLEKLQNSCPHLEELLIDNPRDLISPEGLLRFLEGAKALKHVMVVYGMDKVITDSVFTTLATKPDLETLELQKTITTGLVSKALGQHTPSGAKGRLFPRLSKLACVAQSDGFTALLPHLSQLDSLDVRIEPGGDSSNVSYLLLDVSMYCPNLRVTSLENLDPEGVHISPQSLVRLAERLNQLEKLCISNEKSKVEEFDVSHFASMVKALPRLRTLRLLFKCRLTEAALVEAANSCETLTELEIWGSYDLQNLAETEASFPKLKALELGYLVPPSVLTEVATEAAKTAQFLKRIAPGLEEFSVVSPNPFGQMVSREVDGIYRSKSSDEGDLSTQSDC